MRSLAIAMAIFFGLLVIAVFVGGLMSLFTGRASELPQWNGWAYFVFCAKEGALFGAMLAFPIAILAFVVLWISSQK